MTEAADIFTPTETGCDVKRVCGCTERLDPDWDAWAIIEMCAEHAELAAGHDIGVHRLLDRDLDVTIVDACGGRRVDRLRPRDTTKEK